MKIKRIAVLEDEPILLGVICEILGNAEYECTPFTRSRPLLRSLHHECFDLLILDWNVPDLPGLSVLEWIRNQISDTLPVLILTSRQTDEDIVAGFNAGADDYLAKPINPPILLARIKALLRRSRAPDVDAATSYGPYKFDTLSRQVWLHNTPIKVTPKEFQLALHLFRNANVAVARPYLLETIWGFSSFASTRTLDIHMSNLRRKLQFSPKNGFILSPIYGYGYRLEEVTTP